jgi:diguanylate cyclase (GGDEF)-like protein
VRSYALRWSLIGGALSLGAPAGLAVLRWITGDTVPAWNYIYTGISTLLVFMVFGWFAGRLADAKDELSVRDRLTGLHNRRYLMETLPRLRAITERRAEPLAILMLDLDRFKRVNDTHGHTIGDRTLSAVANTLGETLRDADLVTRYGGEEFVIAAAGLDAERAAEMGERIRAAIEAIGPGALGYAGPQTVSVGVASSSSEDPEALIRRADEALYEAKARGRNRVVVAPNDTGEANDRRAGPRIVVSNPQ